MRFRIDLAISVDASQSDIVEARSPRAALKMAINTCDAMAGRTTAYPFVEKIARILPKSGNITVYTDDDGFIDEINESDV